MSDELDFYAKCLGCAWETNSPKQSRLHAEATGHKVSIEWGED